MENNFFEKVYQVPRQISHGKVITYGAIGQYLGSPKSAKKNVPAHRVVNKQGLLTGKCHFDGVTLVEQLLANEGVVVKNNQIQEMEIYFWDPNKELI